MIVQAVMGVTAGVVQVVMQVMVSNGCSMKLRFAQATAYLLAMQPVPCRPRTATSLWHGGWGSCVNVFNNCLTKSFSNEKEPICGGW